MYQCYHRHSYYSNPITPDVVVSNEEFALRAKELGHGIISGVEHGTVGRYIEGYELSKKYDLKFVFGLESYIVKDRFEKDKTNAHLILLAKNENGRKAINRIVSEANLTGFYYKARIDLNLLYSLPKNDVWVTSACIGGVWKYLDADEIILGMNDYFKNNFFLEVQYHNVESQKILNSHILELSSKNKIPLIFGTDSHYIYPEQSKDRDDYLLSKHMTYDDENSWYLDYPNDAIAKDRFLKQGILSEKQIDEAMSNTNVLLDVEEYTSEIFQKNVKLPTLYPDKTQEEKNKIFEEVIWSAWNKEKANVPEKKHPHYIDEIKKEIKVVIDTKMADYFLIDREVVAKGKELGGTITMTGRGSAPSFYLCKLLGLTTIDRISSPTKLFPERFMTTERILEAQSLPDIDLNLGTPEIFAKAQDIILGENHSYPMSAYGTFSHKAAWKLFARAKDIEFSLANQVSSQIEKYEMELKHASEDEKDEVNIMDFIDEEYHEIFEESKKYLGIVSDSKIHPCLLAGTLILTKDGYKKIEDISINDSVLSHNNRYSKVINIMNRKTEEFYNLKVGSQYLEVTGNHPVYTITNHVDKYGNILSRSNPYWKPVSQLEKNDLVGFSINKESIAPNFDGIPTNSEDFWWMVGAYLGDGFLTSANRKRDKNPCCRINFSIGTKKIEKVENVLDLLGIKYHKANVHENDVEIAFYNIKYWRFLRLFGQYSYGKFLPGFVFDLPKHLLSSMLDGYFFTDGNRSEIEMGFTTVSKELAYGIQACVHKVYERPCSIKISKPSDGEIKGKKFTRRTAYKGRFAFSAGKKSNYIYENEHIWLRYNGKESIKEETIVYNIEVEDDNSYTANNIIVHNCAYLLYQKDIKEEIGIIKIKDHICTVMDGLWAENYKFLKNDLLKVSVVDLIYKVYNRIGITPHPFPELQEMCKGDKKVWDVYKNAWTMGINQVEQKSTSGRVAKYGPKNISELSAFVASVRPGFKSNYKQFEAREPFSYGIPSLDNIIQTEEFPQSYLLYQENCMQVLAYAGIPINQTYEIIKNIAKKRVEKVLKYKEQFLKGMTKKIKEGESRTTEEAKKVSDMIWQILEDSSRYNFNSSHAYSVAGDSLYGAYLKSHYPFEFYETFLRMLEEDADKDRLTAVKNEANSAFGIIFPPFRFGQDNRTIVAKKEENQITSSLASIKGFGKTIGENMYQLGLNHYDTFVDFLIDIEEKGMFTSKIDSLIDIKYFDCFGGNKKLSIFYKEFTKGKNRYSAKHSQKTKIKRIEELHKLWDEIPNENFSIGVQIEVESDILGYVQATYPVDKRYFYIKELDTVYSPRFEAYCLATGKSMSLKIQKKKYYSNPFGAGEILYGKKFTKKPAVKFVDNKYVEDENGEMTWWLDDFDVIPLDKFDKRVAESLTKT